MTKGEVYSLVKNLEQIFEVVRLIDPEENSSYSIDEEGSFIKEERDCYKVWGKSEQCRNCVAAKALSKKEKMTKFDFSESEVCHLIAKYIEMDGVPYVLEMIEKLNDDTLFGAYGKNEFAETVFSYNKKIYADPLTGAYNRQYFDEQLMGFSHINAVAMLDLDSFKEINDTWGHPVGDEVLKAVTRTVMACIRSRDAMIRYGGDEFLIVFPEMPQHVFQNKLNLIREKCGEIVVDSYPELKVSVSIGGYFGWDEMSEKINKADRKLYEAKKEKNSVRIDFDTIG